jgi:glycosyltransferase involved in cell wall biosynthesis
MKKILFLAYYYPPLGGGGVQRSIYFTKYLPEYDYFPTVLTGPEKQTNEHFWQPLDSKLLAKTSGNVNVYRVQTQPPGRESTLKRRVRRLLSLPDSFSAWWTENAIEKAEQVLGAEDFDLIFATMSPYSSARIAAFLSKKYRIPWVADLRDPWALDEVELFPTFVHKQIELFRMQSVLKTAKATIMNTPEAEKRLKTVFPAFINRKVVSITNGYDPEDFTGPNSSRSLSKFRIVHSGFFFTGLGLDMQKKKALNWILRGYSQEVDLFTRSPYYLIRALEEWVRVSPEVLEKVEIIFLGKMSQPDLDLVSASSIGSKLIRAIGYVDHPENMQYLKSADLLFLAMHDLNKGGRATTVYGKTYEYMASGTPILAAVPEGDAREFLERSGTAFLCKPGDWRCMAYNLTRVFNAWESGQRIISPDNQFIRGFERKALTSQLARLFNDLNIK